MRNSRNEIGANTLIVNVLSTYGSYRNIYLAAVLIAILFRIDLNCQELWTSKKPNNVAMYDIWFTDKNSGYIVSGKNAIQKSNDGGKTWYNIYDPSSTSGLKSVHSPNSLVGYFAGENGLIVKTTDAGDSWTHLWTGSGRNIGDIYFINSDTGYIGELGIFRTENGGRSWEKIESGGGECSKITFHDGKTGFASGGNDLLKTQDGGFTWKKLRDNPDRVKEIKIFSPDTIFIGSSSWIHKSFDGGITWDSVSIQAPAPIHNVFFLTTSIAYGVGQYYAIVKTSNGGTKWETLNYSTELGGGLEAIWIHEDAVGVAVGNQLYSTFNAVTSSYFGKSLNKQIKPNNLLLGSENTATHFRIDGKISNRTKNGRNGDLLSNSHIKSESN